MIAPSTTSFEARAMSSPQVRFTVRRAMAAIGIFAVLLSVAIPVVRQIHGVMRRSDLGRRVDGLVRGLRSRCPGSVGPGPWDEAVTWTQIIGPTNLYSIDVIPLPRKARFEEA